MVGLDHHHCGVPSDETSDSPLDVLVTGELGLFLERDRVDVGGGHGGRDAEACLVGAFQQFGQEEPGPHGPVLVGHRIE